ncbi:MAG TPA: phage Gp37/Gp68 family protein [Thermoanaerobaculia bacterium]|nr:phage Gp37/Gp68 family protein [Thermoanaerobaculia bacterium]
MAHGSDIEWTESTWNPVTGCTKISPGCKNCYAERMALRLQAMRQPNYRNGFEVTLQPHMLELPLRWKKPQAIFVNSMSDLFHERVPLSYIQQVFAVMRTAHWHRFQLLTKRAERLQTVDSQIEWPSNVWMGVSVESGAYVGRIDALRGTGAAVKFLSLEPLLNALPSLDLSGIHWVIAGGESGPHARAVRPEWITDLRDQCRRAGIAFFFKQWGGRNKKKSGRMLEGRTWDEMPVPESIPMV